MRACNFLKTLNLKINKQKVHYHSPQGSKPSGSIFRETTYQEAVATSGKRPCLCSPENVPCQPCSSAIPIAASRAPYIPLQNMNQETHVQLFKLCGNSGRRRVMFFVCLRLPPKLCVLLLVSKPPKKGVPPNRDTPILWMDEILHHLRNPGFG